MLIRYLILLLSIFFLIDPISAQKVRVVSPVSHNWKGSKAVFTSDGTQIITGDNEGVIKFWDLETGKLLHTVYHSAEVLKNLILSPNDKWLSSLSDNGEIHIWSMKTGKLHMHIPGEVHWANDVSFSQDSKLIASISYDTAAIWNVETGELLKKWNIGKGGDKILFTPNPNLVFIETFSIEERNNFQIWDYKSAKKIAFPSTNFWATIKGNTMLDWKGDTLVSFNLENGKMTAQWKTGGQKIEKATFCGDNVALYVTSDAVLHKTDLKTGKEIFSLPCKLEKNHNGFFISITVNLQGTYAIVTDHEGNGQIIDVTSGKLLTELPKLNDYNNYYDPCFNNEGNMLAIPGPIDEAVSIWNLPDSNRRMIGKKISLPSTKAVLLKNNYLLSLNDNEFTCFNINTNQPQWTLPIRSNKHDFDNFTPEEKFLFLWNDSGRIAIYSLPDGVIVKEILNTPLKKAALSKDGELVLMINEKEIKIIRVKDDKIIFSKPINKYYENEALFSNDGQYLMWMNAAGWYKKFDLQAGGKADSSFIGKDRFLNYIKQSPDGSKVVVNWRSHGEAFSNVSVLDYATGKILWEIPQKYAWIETIRFSNDGNYVIITTIKGGDAEVRDAGNGKVLGKAEVNPQTIDAGFLKNGQLFYVKENTGRTTFWNSKNFQKINQTDELTTLSNGPGDKLIVATTNDGGVRLIDPEKFNEIVTFYNLFNNGWFAVNPDGLFDMSAGVVNQLHFVINDTANTDNPWTVIEFKQLKERYFQPGLFPAILGLSTEKLRNVPPFERVQIPPKTNLTINQDILTIEVMDGGNGYGRLSLYIDKIEVEEDLLKVLKKQEPNGDKSIFKIDLNKYARFLSQDTINEISVVAWNRDRWLSSRPSTINFSLSGPKGINTKLNIKASETKPSFYALLMGTSDYAGNKLDLNFAAKDASDFANALKISAGKLFGNERTHVVLLHTGAKEDSLQPTRERFSEIMEQFSGKLEPHDVLLIYLSGHGINYGGQDGDFYYLTKSASSDDAAYFQDPAIRQTVAISSNELTAMLNKIVSRKKVLILDACASGKAAEMMTIAMRNVPASQTRALDRLADRTGFYILSGSSADAASYESSMFGQGLLTYSLLKGMRGAALRSDGNEEYVDVLKLLQYAVDEVPQLAKDIGGIQQPLFRSPDDQKSYDLGRVDELIKNSIKLSTPKPMVLAASFINSLENEDDLRLSEAINAYLREITARGREADLLFTEAKSFPGAWKISGSYKIIESKVLLDFRIRRDDIKIDRKLEGEKSKIEDLVTKLVGDVKKLINEIND